MNKLLLCKNFPGAMALMLFLAVSSNAQAACTANAYFTYSYAAGTYSFTNLSTGANKYSWSFGDGTYSTQVSPTHNYPKGVNDQYYYVDLIVSDSTQSNCIDTTRGYIFVRSCPVAPAFGFKVKGYNATFTNTGWVNYLYSWSFGDGSTSSDYKPVHTYSTTGTYSVKLVAWDSNKTCGDSLTKSVLVNGCIATPGYTQKDSGGTHYFTNTSTGANKYYWNFGDGNISTAKNPAHTYASNGKYVVMLVAQDSTINPCSDTLYSYVQDGCLVNADFTYSKVGPDVSYANYSTYANKYYWDFGNGGTSNFKVPPGMRFLPGATYSITLYAIDTTNTGCVDSMTKSIIIPPCSANASFTYSKSNRTVTFTNTSQAAKSYKWQFGNGQTSLSKSPTYTYPTSGTYKVILTAYDSFNYCSDTSVQYITATSCAAKATFTSSVLGLKITLYNNSTGANKYLWKFGDGQTSTAKNPVHTYASAGGYNVTLIATDSTISGCKDSLVGGFYVNPCVISTYFVAKDTLGTVQFYNYTSGANKYFWIFGDGTTSTVKNPAHAYTGPARSFLVKLIAWDTTYTPCTDTTQRYVYSRGCDAAFNIIPDSTNQFSALVFEHSRAGNNTNYVWDFGDGDTSHSRTPSHIYAGTGPYVLCLTIYDSTCVSTYCDTLGFDSSGNILAMRPFSIRVTYPGENYNGQTSVEELEYSNIVKAFPNPAGNSVTVTSNAWNIEQVNLVDIQGKVILQENTMSRSKEINLSSISPGLYFIEVVFDNHKTGRIKLIKN